MQRNNAQLDNTGSRNGKTGADSHSRAQARGEDSSHEPELKGLLGQFISSVEQLEILRLLSEQPGKSWSVQEILRVVQSSELSITISLSRLEDHGFVRQGHPGAYKYEPERNDLEQAAASVCKAYRERRVTVIEAIYQGLDVARSADKSPGGAVRPT